MDMLVLLNENYMNVRYIDVKNNILVWCNVHRRRATKICIKEYDGHEHREFCCDPKLGSILIPCQTENLTGMAELINEN